MSLIFEKTPLLLGLSGGATIVSAIVAMNAGPKNLQMVLGAPLFMGGWGLIIASFIKNDTRDSKYSYPLAASSIGVLMGAMGTRMLTDNGDTSSKLQVTKGLFLASWLAIAVMSGMKKHEENEEHEKHNLKVHGLALLPPTLVVVSMMLVNKIERPQNIASGPGMPLFSAAWAILSLVNSVKLV